MTTALPAAAPYTGLDLQAAYAAMYPGISQQVRYQDLQKTHQQTVERCARALRAERERSPVIARIRSLHRPYKIYDACDHKHTDEDRAAGRAVAVEDVGLTCEDGLMYVVCRECCTDGGYQTEVCATEHQHSPGPEIPICSTAVALEA